MDDIECMALLELADVFTDEIVMVPFLTNRHTSCSQGLMVGIMATQCHFSMGSLESAWWTADGVAKAALGGTAL